MAECAFGKALKWTALLGLATLGSHCSAKPVRQPADDYPWSKVKTPSSGNRHSIGGYSEGCLDGASRLPLDGHGFQAMRPSRNRFYGTAELVDFIGRLTNATMDQKIGVLLIGDMGQPRGGPMPPPGHASHQIGLDVDIWFWLNPDAQYRPLTTAERETLSAISMVDLDKKVIKKEFWRPEHVKILEIASEQPDTERIFVNPVIKRELCETLPAAHRGWLRKLRPWYGHDDHFHVRLKCPPGNKLCKGQDPVPPGDGCDQLDWWFSPEAREAEKQVSSAVRKMPTLPSLCDQVLKDPGIEPSF
jgi:penicillin-insensitive murein endopeptidase